MSNEIEDDDVELSASDVAAIARVRMWSSLTEEEQDRALLDYWNSDDSSLIKSRKQLIPKLAEALRFREIFIQRAKPEKKVELLRKALNRREFRIFHDEFIRAWLIVERRPLLVAFLDGSGIPHEDGFSTDEDPPTAEQFEKGIQALNGTFLSRDIALYLCYLVLFSGSSGYWNELPDAPTFQQYFSELMDLEGDDSPALPEEEPNETNDALDDKLKGATKLDDWLIRLAVSSAFEEEGSPDEDTLEDMVEEVVELNASRHRSLFHRGFFHALFERDPRFSFPAENEARRQWYACGYIFGLIRRRETSKAVDILTQDQPEMGEELATSRATPCGAKLLPVLAGPLLDASQFDFARQFIRRQFHQVEQRSAAEGICLKIYEKGSSLLRQGKYSEAEKLIELLIEITGDVESPIFQEISRNALRRKAQCQQAKGSFAKAQSILESIQQVDDDELPPNGIADLGLIHGSLRTLSAALPKPTKDKNKSLIKALNLGKPCFVQAIDQYEDNATNAHFCIGILLTLEGNPSNTAQVRADHLQHALGGMLDLPTAYATEGLHSWVEFLLALALLETAEASIYQGAFDHAISSIKSETRFPSFLWERLFEAATLFDDPGLSLQIGSHLLQNDTSALDCLLKNASVLAANSDLLQSLLEAFMKRQTSVSKQWKFLRQLLPVCLKNQALEPAGTILDRLEQLAIENKPLRSVFIEMLGDSDSYSPAWEAVDAGALQAKCLEIEGLREEAAEILRDRFYQLKASGEAHQHFEALQIISQIESLGQTGVDCAELAALLPCHDEKAPVDTALRGRVLYIGGNETQEGYREHLTKEISEEHPDLAVEFVFPGWTSNWNVHLAKLKPRIAEADVIVINSLIRTQLGRHLRATCNSEHPWLPCTGRGRESLKRSILGAARWVADQKPVTS